MSKQANPLKIYYIDFSNQSETGSVNNQKIEVKDIAKRLAVDFLVPGGIFYNGYKRVEGVNKETIEGAISPINSEEVLNSYKNALGNQWVIRSNPLDPIGQFYVRHPKLCKSNLLIEANQFNKYIYDEYCAELVNYCCTHCPAKSIRIVSNKVTGAKLGGGYKFVEAGFTIGKQTNEVYSIEADCELNHPPRLKHYTWIDSRTKQAIDTLPEGGKFHYYVDQDFSFNTGANIWKYIKADMNFAHTYRFTIDIEC